MNLKKMKLAPKIALILSVMLVVIFGVLIVYTVISASSSLTKAISAELTAVSKGNGTQVQQIIDAATTATSDMEAYLQKAYVMSAEGKRNMAGESKSFGDTATQTYKSMLYKVPITELSADVEKYITETARNTAVSNSDIVAIGAYFESYKFDDAIKDYAFYVKETIGDADIEPYGAYEEYASQDYYKKAKEQKKTVFTDPYEYDGVMMVTVATPILYNDEVMGVIIADINVTNFSKVNSTSESYPTMYAAIFSQEGNTIYDSEDINKVGKNMSNFYALDSEYQTVLSNFSKGEAFQISTLREDQSQVTRFFQPIKAGDSYWWSLTALDTADMNAETISMVVILAIISVIALVLLIVVTVTILSRMLKPIAEIEAAAKSLSNGNVHIEIKHKSGDELGNLADSMRTTVAGLEAVITDMGYLLTEMANGNFKIQSKQTDKYINDFEPLLGSARIINSKLSNALRQINQSSEQVSSGAEQVSSGAQALSQGATEQASSVEELAATITEISAQIKQTAQNAADAANKANSVGQEADESNNRMKEMLAAMDQISETSNEIGKIIKTIEDIAFQTNILALNAAVEAARAGAAGKGFAVVADEVRNLASKSAEASKNTSVLIESSIEAVKNGTRIANETAASLGSVVDGIQEVVQTVDVITVASKEEANAIVQVTTGVDQISAVVQTNSATSEESAAASEELSGQAQMLKDMVGKFTLADE